MENGGTLGDYALRIRSVSVKAKFTPLANDLCYCGPDKDGDYFFDEHQALMNLLKANVCFFGSVWHPDRDMDGKDAYLGIGVFVNCNDLFYWACADAETMKQSEVEDLYRQHIANLRWGATLWACKHRNLQPQVPVKEKMIKEGVWNAELNALPDRSHLILTKAQKIMQ